MAELSAVLKKSDAEIEEYLDNQPRFNMNGLETKRDIESFFDSLREIHFPIMEEENAEIFVYITDAKVDYIEIIYEFEYSKVDFVKYCFIVYTKENSFQGELQALQLYGIELKDHGYSKGMEIYENPEKPERVYRDSKGRFICLDIFINEREINIYMMAAIMSEDFDYSVLDWLD
jgi:hypothetical protein